MIQAGRIAMTDSIAGVKALAWDIGGTVFDWHGTIREEMQGIARARGVELDNGRFANAWRRRMFERLAEVRSGALPRLNADALHRMALDDILPDFPALTLSP